MREWIKDMERRINKQDTWVKKLTRQFTALLPIDKTRKGKCNRCGACCKFKFACPFLRYDKDNKSYCIIYHTPFRLPICRKYPQTEKDCITQDTCGYRFDKE